MLQNYGEDELTEQKIWISWEQVRADPSTETTCQIAARSYG